MIFEFTSRFFVSTTQVIGQCQDECGIQTVPDRFSPFPMTVKEAVWSCETSEDSTCPSAGRHALPGKF